MTVNLRCSPFVDYVAALFDRSPANSRRFAANAGVPVCQHLCHRVGLHFEALGHGGLRGVSTFSKRPRRAPCGQATSQHRGAILDLHRPMKTKYRPRAIEGVALEKGKRNCLPRGPPQGSGRQGIHAACAGLFSHFLHSRSFVAATRSRGRCRQPARYDSGYWLTATCRRHSAHSYNVRTGQARRSWIGAVSTSNRGKPPRLLSLRRVRVVINQIGDANPSLIFWQSSEPMGP